MLQSIPLTNEPNQTFQVSLQVNGRNERYQFTFRWNAIAEYWVYSVKDLSNGRMKLDSSPLVSGSGVAINLLRPYVDMKIGEAYLLSRVDKPQSTDPGMYNMNEFALFWDDNV